MSDRIGQQLGNYRLIRLLGKGGFAEVYLGEHIHLNTQVAIKVLYTHLTSEDVEHFRTEARIVASLLHPHIVRVLDYGLEGTTPFLVMDYAPNGTLRQRYPKGSRLALPTIISYVKQAADALQFAHDQKLIHLDIKPENMLLGATDEVLLSDFGLALIAHHTASQIAQVMAGTIPYMAPEQLQGRPRPASDQYALGIVVYEWLTGDRPFQGSFMGIASQHVLTPPPPLSEKVLTILPEVEHVILTALEKDPHRRFGSMQAFATALEQACQTVPSRPVVVPTQGTLPSELSQPTDEGMAIKPSQAPLPIEVTTSPGQSALPPETVTPPSQSLQAHATTTPPTTPMASPVPSPTELRSPNEFQPSRRRISRRTVVVAGVGLIGVSVVGGGIIWLTHAQPLAHSRQGQGSPTAPAPASPSPIIRRNALYTYHGHSGSVWSVRWSPDGKRIASGSADGTVQVWDATTGGNVFIYRGQQPSARQVTTFPGVQSAQWSSDGKRIASGSADGTVQVWDAATGGNVLTYQGHSGVVETVAWSPDGKRIASANANGTVHVWNASTGKRLLTYSNQTALVNSVTWSPDGERIASGCRDRTAQIWDTVSGKTMIIYHGHSDVVFGIAWSPDGGRIASGSRDETAQVWDAVSGDHIVTYSGHSNSVYSVAWSLDSRRIASCSYDSTVQVWSASTGGNILSYFQSAPVNDIAWSPDNKLIASCSRDTNTTVQVWQAI
jgi:eukaryotic-like serine/threonine-protein kinase